MNQREQLRAHGEDARQSLAVVERWAASTCESRLLSDLSEMERAFHRLETAIGAMRVMAIAALANEATCAP